MDIAIMIVFNVKYAIVNYASACSMIVIYSTISYS